MKKLAFALLFNCLALTAFGQLAFFDAADAFFGAYVKDGKVAYAQLKSNANSLNALLAQVSTFEVSKADKATQKAFYLNAYNICTIAGIIRSYPTNGPLAIEGFFDKATHNVAGKHLTLNQLENEVIRPTFQDPRVHFALVCAAESCPKLISKAYRPTTVEKQLEAQTEANLADRQFIRVDDSGKKVLISKIFEWYAQDFGGKEGFLAFINHYRKQKISEAYTIDFYEYSWKLNAQ